MDEAGLCRLQFLQGPLGGVARRADLGLGALALGDVAVNHHKATARHRVAPYFDNTPVGSDVLKARFLAEPFKTAVQLRLDVGAAILAAPGKEADIFGIRKTLRQQ